MLKLGLIGVRGYVGREVLRLVAAHPQLELIFASSREIAGQPVSTLAPEAGDLVIETIPPDDAPQRGADIIILGLPNGLAAPYVEAIDAISPETLIIDLSADYRFQDAWAYGLPELYKDMQGLMAAKRIANPGCYATMAQLAIYPALRNFSVAQDPNIFAVSGYSGAGTKPGPTNDPERLANNLMPYKLTGHIHEKEIGRHLGRNVRFTPHVHPAFSGLLVTVHLSFDKPLTREVLKTAYIEAYADHPLVTVQDTPPELKDSTGIPGAIIGGFEVTEDGLGAVIVAAGDNLLKGAAVQALQNISLACDIELNL